MAKTSHHVVPAPDGGWSVRKSGADRASRHFPTQEKAVSWAREVSRNARGELVIHRRDGTIRAKDSHSQDPLPPRDKK